MRRVEAERGAVAVLVAIVMVALIGFAAIGVDVANMASDRQQLQNGADAGAFAIAQYCAEGGANCVTNHPDRMVEAESFADTNKNDGEASVEEVLFNGAQVTVTLSDDTEHWFAPVFGLISGGDFSKTEVRASATAGTANYGGGRTLPFGVYLGYIQCLAGAGSTFTQTAGGGYEFVGSTPPTNVELYFEKFDNTSGCAVGGNYVPGGFGWLQTEVVSGTEVCNATTSFGATYDNPGYTGVAVPNACKTGKMDELVGTTVALPIFENPPTGTGSNATYTIAGYVGFHLLGFEFPADGSAATAPCSKCFYGYFDTLANITGGVPSSSAPNWGATIIQLKN